MQGLWIKSGSYPDILYDDLQSSKYMVFGDSDPSISTFDGYANYYHFPQDIHNFYPINYLASFLLRIYTNNYLSLIRGDILVYGSLDGLPMVIDSDVPYSFLEQVALYVSSTPYVPQY